MPVWNLIDVHCDESAHCWTATHSGPWADELVDLFGTAVLPTPFTCAADERTVVLELAERNDNVKVVGPTLTAINLDGIIHTAPTARAGRLVRDAARRPK